MARPRAPSRGGTPTLSAASMTAGLSKKEATQIALTEQRRHAANYFVRVVANIGAFAERAGMALRPRSDICSRKALV